MYKNVSYYYIEITILDNVQLTGHNVHCVFCFSNFRILRIGLSAIKLIVSAHLLRH